MALPPHARDWLERAEIDYVGPFVKAWAAFNAWYRHDSGQSRERDMLNFAIRNNNSRLRRRVLPLLRDNNTTADAERLKQAICDLQRQLDKIHWEVRPRGRVERVSLREVCIAPNHLQDDHMDKSGQRYRARKIHGGRIEVSVTTISNGNAKFSHAQQRYDPPSLYVLPEFINNLSGAQQTRLRAFYDGCNPRPTVDLVQGGGPHLQVSTMHFQCTNEDLLAGLVETLYAMRNALLHGEVDPDEQVLACFEPAYKIVTGFLRSIG
ncbi:hypothetical protein [uncultured Algimonas sp.]|uniref:hypothetical protein n=1 Tax=uncultured Algimonas sp. TaxID=1547920 RepID=UPI00260FB2AA|nr:hypothetical protein [uncultured Algimonas sp.]